MKQSVWRQLSPHRTLFDESLQLDSTFMRTRFSRGMRGSTAIGEIPKVRAGLTLIEVVVSVALMAILLTAVLMAYGRHTRQIRRAHQRLSAVKACDDLIAHWMERPSEFAGRTSGVFPAQPEFRWRVVSVVSPQADAMEAQVLRWEVFPAIGERPSPPIVQVDLLVAKPEAGK